MDDMKKTTELFGFSLEGETQSERERLPPSARQPVEDNQAPQEGQDPGSSHNPQELPPQFYRFLEAGKQITLLAGLDALLPTIAYQAKTLAEADGAGILIPKGDCLEVVTVGLDGVLGRTIPAERSLAGWVARMGEPVVIVNITKASPSWEKELLGPAGFLSHLLLPIEWAGKIIAVLSVHNRRERHWAPHEIGLLDTFVGFIAVALENARLYREVEEGRTTVQKLNQELEEAISLKSKFLCTVSHELRTPMSTIIGYSHLIAEDVFGEISAGMQGALEKVIKAADHLLTMINNMLDHSQIDAGAVIIRHDPVNLKPLLNEVCTHATTLLSGRPVVLHCDYDRDLPTIFTDIERLKQVLSHLLDNAAKFTHEGKIVLRASAAAGEVELSVEDTGIGIQPEKQQMIFDGFRQVEDTDTRSYGGLGLGLYMVRRLLELMGGKITVESQIGQGSTFRIRLPIGEVE